MSHGRKLVNRSLLAVTLFLVCTVCSAVFGEELKEPNDGRCESPMPPEAIASLLDEVIEDHPGNVRGERTPTGQPWLVAGSSLRPRSLVGKRRVEVYDGCDGHEGLPGRFRIAVSTTCPPSWMSFADQPKPPWQTMQLLTFRCLRFLHLCIGVIVLGVGLIHAALAEDPATLVRRLGHASPSVRAEAADELAVRGRAAREVLLDGLTSDDAEIRRRCRWLLADALEADIRGRIDAFEADAAGSNKHDVPGWAPFSEIAGSGPTARDLFVAMHRESPGLMSSFDCDAKLTAGTFSSELRQTYAEAYRSDPKRRKSPSTPRIAALLLTAARPGMAAETDERDSQRLYVLISYTDFSRTLAEGNLDEPLKRLIGRWIRMPTRGVQVTSKLTLAAKHKIPEGVDLAARVIEKKPQLPANHRTYAVATLGLIGGREHAARLLPLLHDETVCANKRVGDTVRFVQMRDVALVWLIQLTGQSHADYGFPDAKGAVDRAIKSNRPSAASSSFTFVDDAAREKALKKWNAYLAEHPLPEPPEIACLSDEELAFELRFSNLNATESSSPDAVVMMDRLQANNLQAARDLIARQRYAEATSLLGRILHESRDGFYRPDVSAAQHSRLKAIALQLLGSLPPRGIDAYRLQFEAQARERVAAAVTEGDVVRLEAVGEEFFYTAAGAEANYLAGVRQWHAGAPLQAALRFERLRDESPDAARFEPDLSLRLAVAWRFARMPARSEAVLLELKQRWPDATFKVADQTRELFGADAEAMRWLESILKLPPLPPQQESWLTPGGSVDGNRISNVGGPSLRAERTAPACRDEKAAGIVEELLAVRRADRRIALPAQTPIVAGDALLMRTVSQLVALDPTDGRTLWRADLEDPLRRILASCVAQTKLSDWAKENLDDDLQRRMWSDHAYGDLTSDGRLVFSVEGNALASQVDYRRTVMLRDGRHLHYASRDDGKPVGGLRH